MVQVSIFAVERSVVVDDQRITQAGSKVERIERIEREPNMGVAGEEADFRGGAKGEEFNGRATEDILEKEKAVGQIASLGDWAHAQEWADLPEAAKPS